MSDLSNENLKKIKINLKELVRSERDRIGLD